MALTPSYLEIYTRGITRDNPYFNQLQNPYLSKTDFKRLLSAAIEKQSQISDYERELSDQRALRDEDREYNDYKSVVARQRAAGLNPDLMGVDGAGGSSGGFSSAPDMESPDLTDLSTPLEQASTAASVMQGAGSLVSSVTGGIKTLTDVYQSVKNFDNVFRLGEATAESAEAAASVAQSDALMQNALNRIGLFTKAAESFVPDTLEDGSVAPATLDNVRQHLISIGADPNDADAVKRLIDNPALVAKNNEALHAANKSKADAVTYTFDAYQRLSEVQLRLEESSKNAAFLKSRVEESLYSFLNDGGFAEKQATNMMTEQDVLSESLGNRDVALDLERQKILHDTEAFISLQKSRVDYRNELAARISKIKDDPKLVASPEGIAEIRALSLELSLIDSQSSQDLYGFVSTINEANRRLYVMESTGMFGQDPGRKGKYLGESVLKPDFVQKDRNPLNYVNLMWNQFYTDPDRAGQILTESVGGLVNAGTAYLGAKLGSKGSSSLGVSGAGISNSTPYRVIQ